MSYIETLIYLANKAKNIDKIFDPSVFNDELALKIDWNPIEGANVNFVSYKLSQVSMFKLTYRPNIQTYIFVLLFTIFVGFFLTLLTLILISELVTVKLFGIGLIYISIVIAGLFLTRSIYKPKSFDKYDGWYYIGKNVYRKDDMSNPKQCQLDSIYAIQLLSKWVSDPDFDTPRHYCQMNLVLKDTSRIHLLNIRSLRTVRRDSEIIARFLGIPVWDSI